MKKAILYLRSRSLEYSNQYAQNQYDIAQNYCAKNGIEIVRVFDEISTEPPYKRYYFDKALKVVKLLSGQLTYFVVFECSQISERGVEYEAVKEELKASGVYILSICADKEYLGSDMFENETPEQ